MERRKAEPGRKTDKKTQNLKLKTQNHNLKLKTKKTEKQKEVKAIKRKKEGKQGKERLKEAVKKRSSQKAGKEPESMAELLAATGYKLKAPQRGQRITGVVTDVSRRMVLVDIGAKTEGIVVDKEYEEAEDLVADLQVGDDVAAVVVSPENDKGQILLSLKQAVLERRWQIFEEKRDTGEAILVRGLEVNKGGMVVRSGGVRGFVPASQFGTEYLGRMENLLNKQFKVKVIEVDEEKNRLIFSEKLVSEAEALAKKDAALSRVKVNGVYDGVVSGIMPFGVFVTVRVTLAKGKGKQVKSKVKLVTDEEEDRNVGRVDGLVHISEISWEKVDDPNAFYKVGAQIKVKVLAIDKTAGKLNLSVKRLTGDPWDKVIGKYAEGKKFKTKVTRVAPFGAFVTLEPGVEGLIHISKIPAGNEPKPGDEREVFVETVDVERRRISLGLVLKEVPVGYK